MLALSGCGRPSRSASTPEPEQQRRCEQPPSRKQPTAQLKGTRSPAEDADARVELWLNNEMNQVLLLRGVMVVLDGDAVLLRPAIAAAQQGVYELVDRPIDPGKHRLSIELTGGARPGTKGRSHFGFQQLVQHDFEVSREQTAHLELLVWEWTASDQPADVRPVACVRGDN